MSRINRKRRRISDRPGLTDAQELELLIGGVEGAFSSTKEYREAWWRYRDWLMAGVTPPFRPEAWWKVEFKGPLPPRKDRITVLQQMGLLNQAKTTRKTI